MAGQIPGASGLTINVDGDENTVIIGSSNVNVKPTDSEPLDMLKKFKGILKEKYKQISRKIKPTPWKSSASYGLNRTYTSVTLLPGEDDHEDVTGGKKGQNVTKRITKMDSIGDIFCTVHNDDQDEIDPEVKPRRILVEGRPGMGKTTACIKLIHDWAFARDAGETSMRSVHSFQLVIFLRAREMEETDDVLDAIIKQAIGRERETDKDEICAVFKDHQEDVLFLIDGYDELKHENKSLSELLSLCLFPQSTVLLTSRPSFLGSELQQSFNTTYHFEGLSSIQQSLFIQKMNDQCDPKQTEGFVEELKSKVKANQNLLDLCSNPHYLAIIWELSVREGVVSPSSKGDLYRRLEKFLVKIAQKRDKSLTQQALDGLINKLGKVAFDLVQMDRYQISEKELREAKFTETDIQNMRHFGFFTQSLILNQQEEEEEAYFEFNHKSFAEYLAAKHLVADEANRSERVEDALLSNKWEEVLSFAVGIVCNGKRPGDVLLHEVITPWANVHYPKMANYTYSDNIETYTNVVKMLNPMCSSRHAVFHRILGWLCEFDVEKLKGQPEALTQIMEKITDILGVFFFNKNKCTYICLQGFGKFCDAWAAISSDLTRRLLIDVYVIYTDPTMEDFLKVLSKAPIVNKVVLRWFNWAEVVSAISKLDVGGESSNVSKLVIYTYSRFTDTTDGDVVFGPRLQSLEVIEADRFPRSVKCLLAGIKQGQQVQQLHFYQCDVDEECVKVMPEKIRKLPKLESFMLVEPGAPSKDSLSKSCRLNLLRALKQSPKLSRIHLSNLLNEADYMQAFSSEKELDSLCIDGSKSNDESLAVAACAVHKNSGLQQLRFQNVIMGMFPNANLKSLPRLHTLSLLKTKLPSTDYVLLSVMLYDMRSLKELFLSITDQESVDSIAAGFHEELSLETFVVRGENGESIDMAQFAVGISSLNSLRILRMEGVRMATRDHFKPLANAMVEHPKLQVIALRNANLNDENLPDLVKLFGNEHIEHLDLNMNKTFSVGAWHAARQCIRRKKSLGYLDIDIGTEHAARNKVYAELNKMAIYMP